MIKIFAFWQCDKFETIQIQVRSYLSVCRRHFQTSLKQTEALNIITVYMEACYIKQGARETRTKTQNQEGWHAKKCLCLVNYLSSKACSSTHCLTQSLCLDPHGNKYKQFFLPPSLRREIKLSCEIKPCICHSTLIQTFRHQNFSGFKTTDVWVLFLRENVWSKQPALTTEPRDLIQ